MFEQILEKKTRHTLALLSKQPFMANFYLTGGTACALYLGHRKSFDLDFFSQKNFNTQELREKLKNLGQFSLESEEKNTLHIFLNKTRISFLGYKYPLLYPLKKYLGINIASLQDIAATKIDTIASRGAKKDFVDLYFIGQEYYPLDQILKFFSQKYKEYNYNLIHILKSLTYFQEVEVENGELIMLKKVSWSKVKIYFQEAVKGLQGVINYVKK